MDTADAPRRLRAARVLADLTVQQLADKLDTPGLGAKTIGAIERGERAVRPHEIRVVAEALNVPVEFFTAGLSYNAGSTDDDRAEYLRLLHAILEIVKDLSTWESAPVWQRVIDAREKAVDRLIEAFDERFDAIEARLEAISPTLTPQERLARSQVEAARRTRELREQPPESTRKPDAQKETG